MIRTLIFALLTLGSTLMAQDLKELREDLCAPEAYKRVVAGAKYAEKCELKDLERLFEGYETRYWNGKEYEYTKHPADPNAFMTVLVHWPKCITKDFIDKLYKYEDSKEFPRYEMEHVIAYSLCQNALDLDRDTKVGRLTRDYWYDTWREEGRNRINDLIWRDVYLNAAKKSWLVDKILEDDDVYITAKLILAVFADRHKEEKYATLLQSDAHKWLLYFADHKDKEKLTLPLPNPELCSWIRTPIGYMARADLVAVLCNRPEWLEDLKGELSKPESVRVKLRAVPGFPNALIPSRHFPINEALRTKTLRADLDKLFRDKANVWYFAERIQIWAILQFPWFQDLRETEEFEKWWNDWNHRYPVVPYDPTFGLPR